MSLPVTVSPLDRPAQFLKGVGPKRAQALERLGVRSARDLVYHVPRRYEDASTLAPIASLEVGADATVIGEVVSKGVIPTRKGLRIFQAVLRDQTGLIECAWPGQPFLDRSIRKGDLLLVTGPVRFFHGRQLQPREHITIGRAESQSPDSRRGSGDEAKPVSVGRMEGRSLDVHAPRGEYNGERSPLGGMEGRVLPIYPATEGLSQRVLRAVLDANLDTLLGLVEAEEIFMPGQLERAGVPPLRDALEALHRPASIAAAERGRRRLAYEELFFLQLVHARARRRASLIRPGIAFRRSDELIGALYRRLPFALTGAQTRALREIFEDMTAPRRMNRLLQGDVGSGKTVVALFAMLLAVENGFQAALMAPTEILAEQHARTLRELLGELPVEVTLLTGRLAASQRREALERIGNGAAQLVVGTHALIQEGVEFHRLGLAVVDEQHRFGVRQRMALVGRPHSGENRAVSLPREPLDPERRNPHGRNLHGPDSPTPDSRDRPTPDSPDHPTPDSPDRPEVHGLDRPEVHGPDRGEPDGAAADTLVMSATPIPRSLALTLYGDLDLTILDERPPGRQPVRTVLRDEDARARVHAFVREQVAAGRQAYIVYPLVEQSDKLELRAAADEVERLQSQVFPDLRLGLLHGQMAGEDKDAAMLAFAAGELDILVATTVIEVGIDVPNATVMLIEHAERFGLSQLHQLRGRVGRGAAESYCVLIAARGEDTAHRLGTLVESDDGFEIARVDLRLRGMGDFFGARQHGLPEFRFFDPETDEALLARAQADARAVIERDPQLTSNANGRLRSILEARYGEREQLYEVG